LFTPFNDEGLTILLLCDIMSKVVKKTRKEVQVLAKILLSIGNSNSKDISMFEYRVYKRNDIVSKKERSIFEYGLYKRKKTNNGVILKNDRVSKNIK